MAKKKDRLANERAQMRALYGKNERIDGEYDRSLSAVCDNGIFVGEKCGDLNVYKGIPFAKPPVGNLRWKAPVRPDNSCEVRQAKFFGPSPIQTELFSEMGSLYVQSEDCLYLNIWTSPEGGENKSVMVFFHGGSYGWGGTSDPIYEGSNFVNAHKDIVLVSVEYRTGIMGFIDLSYIKGGEDFPDSANLGILDQIESLRWIQRNIKSFGGDPENVTIFGESAGGGSVSLLPVIKEAKGLFKRAIAESGSIALTFSKKECKGLTRRLLLHSLARSMDDLMALSEDKLKKINESLNDYNNFPMRDGKLIPEDLYEAYNQGIASDIDMISGTNSDEARYWIRELGGLALYTLSIPVLFGTNKEKMIMQDRKRANRFLRRQKGLMVWRRTMYYTEILFRVPATVQTFLHHNSGGNSYLYYWKMPSAIANMGACHAVELSYVFANPKCNIYTGGSFDKNLSDTVGEMWTNFAKYGDPSTKDIKWPQYDVLKRTSMVFDKQMHTEDDILRENREELEPLLKYRFNGYYAELNFKIPYVAWMAAATLFLIAVIIAAIIFILKAIIGF